MALPEFWKGSLTTGRQGYFCIRLRENGGGTIIGRLILFDYFFGPSWSSLTGTLTGSGAELTLGEFHTLAPLSASGGQVFINFDSADSRSAKGYWYTEFGMGRLTAQAMGMAIGLLGWWCCTAMARAVLLLKWLYGLLLMFLFFLSATARVSLSAPLLFLAFIPAPFLFQRYIARLVSIFGIQSVGPIQLAGAQTTGTGRLFSSLDSFLELRIKTILIWVAEQEGRATVSALGKACENSTLADHLFVLHTLVVAGCVKAPAQPANVLEVTNLGRRYVAYCLEEE